MGNPIQQNLVFNGADYSYKTLNIHLNKKHIGIKLFTYSTEVLNSKINKRYHSYKV